MKIRHFHSVRALTKKELGQLFDFAALKEQIFVDFQDILRTKILATYFASPSFRTCLSFSSAFMRLGGNTLSVPDSVIHNITNRDLADVARQLSFYSDYIVVRTNSAAEFNSFTRHSKVPVLSAGHGKKEHPTTGISHLFSLYEKFKRLDNLTVLIIAKLPKRGVNSFLDGLAFFCSNRVFIRTPGKHCLAPEIEARFTKDDRNQITYIGKLDEIPDPRTIDAILIDDAKSDFQPKPEKDGYWVPEITRRFIGLLPPHTFITAGLPRTKMTPSWLDRDPRSHYVSKSLNSLYIRAGIFMLFEGQLM